DMIRVPGSISSLQLEKASGKDIRICYSPLDALDFAKNNPEKDVVFLGIGFETTIPLSSVIVKRAYKENINNFYIFNIHKLVPPALELLLLDEEIKIDGFLCPGHVSAIIGSLPYNFIADKYRIPCVISGFEPLDIMESLNMLMKQYNSKIPEVQIQYRRVVTSNGNPTAVSIIDEIFEPCDSYWRGIGVLPKTGLKLREEYMSLDAMKKFPVEVTDSKEPPGCQCGSVLKGIIKPFDCKLFSRVCKPENPIGPCMVSSEGSCAAYYKYERLR
ncbi:MAG: hydrogenase formation protein HypD, partial [Candidatus Humimicrobiaceae bacterium]